MSDGQYKITVLIIDDVKVMRSILKKQLGAASYNVLEAEDGSIGYRLALKEKPDIILLDVMMPVQDGFECLKELKQDEKTKDIPVIMCTAKGERKDVLEAKSLGAVDYIVKPFKFPILDEKIKSIIKKK